VGESEFEQTYLRDPQVDLAAHVGDPARSPEEVSDAHREAIPGEPPEPGAQWDELHKRWELWDEAAQQWKVVGDAGDGVAPADENPLPPFLARELVHDEDLEAAHPAVPDLPRSSPEGPAPRGAQWNEVAARWERWDEESGEWVEATADSDGPAAE
jgi:hypothetical protein